MDGFWNCCSKLSCSFKECYTCPWLKLNCYEKYQQICFSHFPTELVLLNSLLFAKMTRYFFLLMQLHVIVVLLRKYRLTGLICSALFFNFKLHGIFEETFLSLSACSAVFEEFYSALCSVAINIANYFSSLMIPCSYTCCNLPLIPSLERDDRTYWVQHFWLSCGWTPRYGFWNQNTC